MIWLHVYLYGRGFTLITDHKLLIAVFHPEKGVPAMSVARLQRYALFLAGFDYKIEYQSRTKHCNAISCELFLKMLDSTTHNLTEFSLNRLKELRRAICFWGIFKSCFPSSVATDGKDNHGFKLEKIDGMPENHQKSYYG